MYKNNPFYRAINRKSSGRARRESSKYEKNPILWTSFHFPPRKAKKLDDLLSVPDKEENSLKVKAQNEALQQIQEKAINLGIMDKKKGKKYFYQTEEELEKVERELL